MIQFYVQAVLDVSVAGVERVVNDFTGLLLDELLVLSPPEKAYLLASEIEIGGERVRRELSILGGSYLRAAGRCVGGKALLQSPD